VQEGPKASSLVIEGIVAIPKCQSDSVSILFFAGSK
jgi:hypothetical protein